MAIAKYWILLVLAERESPRYREKMKKTHGGERGHEGLGRVGTLLKTETEHRCLRQPRHEI